MVERFELNRDSRVVELASNDGYLLQYFVQKGIPVLGIEPAANVAAAAEAKGVPTRVEFFNESSAQRLVAEGHQADLVIGNNVLAQVPDLNGFVEGMKILLKPSGVITIEFPHLMRLVAENQFDTIYHEHFSYFCFTSIVQRLRRPRADRVRRRGAADARRLAAHLCAARVERRAAGDERARELLARESATSA